MDMIKEVSFKESTEDSFDPNCDELTESDAINNAIWELKTLKR